MMSVLTYMSSTHLLQFYSLVRLPLVMDFFLRRYNWRLGVK